MRNNAIPRVKADIPVIVALIQEHGELSKYELAELLYGPARGSLQRQNTSDRAYRRLDAARRAGFIRENRPGNGWVMA